MRYLRLSGLVLTALLALGLGIGPAASAEQGGTMVMLVQPEPPSLASYLSTSGPIGMVTSKVFDGLLEYDLDLQPQPGLAESWTVAPDGLTLSFKIRQGVTFHDGRPLTVEDVKFSIMDVAKITHPRGPNTFRSVTMPIGPDVERY